MTFFISSTSASFYSYFSVDIEINIFDIYQAVASGNLHFDALLKANFQAAPMSIPIIALSFVYQVISLSQQTSICRIIDKV